MNAGPSALFKSRCGPLQLLDAKEMVVNCMSGKNCRTNLERIRTVFLRGYETTVKCWGNLGLKPSTRYVCSRLWGCRRRLQGGMRDHNSSTSLCSTCRLWCNCRARASAGTKAGSIPSRASVRVSGRPQDSLRTLRGGLLGSGFSSGAVSLRPDLAAT